MTANDVRHIVTRVLPLWKRLPDALVNCGMGGDEDCRLYRHRLTGFFKCVTKNRYGRWTFATIHETW